jgi:membrane protein implicated in regulation of membrane protease activity
MGTWIVWLIVAAALGAAEIMTATLAFGLTALAALAAAVAGVAGGSTVIEFGVFVVTAAGGLGLGRPFAMRYLRQPPLRGSAIADLIGRPAIVLDDVSDRGGRVRIAGEEWAARSWDSALIIPAGSTAKVVQIEGRVALVYPRA